MNILVTGGAGYIGSHTIVELIEAGHSIVIVDNLINSSEDVVTSLVKMTGVDIPFYKCDIRDKSALDDICKKHRFDCCIHFAGLKAVGESVEQPELYYDNNVNGTLSLLEVLEANGCKNIIFSSSATVYGQPDTVPIKEEQPKKQCTNPYGETKSIIEDKLEELYRADIEDDDPNPWNIVILRYFNPIGAHLSGLIGENTKGTPNNLFPYITQVAAGKLEYLSVFGDDYDTPDGTGVRDYIHVVDLAKGHVKALEAIERNCGLKVYNLGTGRGYSVLELVKTFERVTGKTIPYKVVGRREGDVDSCYADPSKAYRELGWKAEYGIEDMCLHGWKWQENITKELEEGK